MIIRINAGDVAQLTDSLREAMEDRRQPPSQETHGKPTNGNSHTP